jgi:hypothetical protein
MLENNVTHSSINGTIAGVMMLQAPDDKVSDSELYWKAYFSEIYVNAGAWQNFTTGQQNETEEGSQAVSGTGPIQASLYSKFIDSTGNNDTTNPDTLVVWGSEYHKLDNGMAKRNDETVYAIMLSRTSHVDDETFNKTLGYLPSQLTANNTTFVNLNDTCSSDANEEQQ